MFQNEEMPWRPALRARSVHEQMVHQCVSEDYWMKNFLGIDLGEPPLPVMENRLEFMKKYAAASSARLSKLQAMQESWYEENASFFDVVRSRAWILVRRIAHSAHHRGQLTTYLRISGHQLYSTYGPTADTGGLFQNGARVIYHIPMLNPFSNLNSRGAIIPRCRALGRNRLRKETPSGSLLRRGSSGTQRQPHTGFKCGRSSYLRFVIRELIQTERLGELLLGESLFGSDNGGAARTFLSLWRIKKDELLDLTQFR